MNVCEYAQIAGIVVLVAYCLFIVTLGSILFYVAISHRIKKYKENKEANKHEKNEKN